MQLFILRHADAEEARSSLSDFERKLTAKGEAQSRRVGKFLANLEGRPGVILSSPVKRAAQTARIVAKTAGLDDPLEEAFLSCGMRPEAGIAALAPYKKFESVLIVGHQPDLGDLASTLLGIGGPGLEMKKAALAILVMAHPAPGAASLRFHSIPSLLPA